MENDNLVLEKFTCIVEKYYIFRCNTHKNTILVEKYSVASNP